MRLFSKYRGTYAPVLRQTRKCSAKPPTRGEFRDYSAT